MKFNLENLAKKISVLDFDDRLNLTLVNFGFEDAAVWVDGWIFKNEQEYAIDIHSVTVFYEDGLDEFTTQEINKLENEIKL